ncbi:MAG: homoserine O-acetyltransferase [Segetibacter sp.]|nr:homoserine O-acetyltransferase [Segetibacter sp.]
MKYFTSNAPFCLESGATLPSVTIAYHTFGTLNKDKSNVVWICHALTSNSNVIDWWPGIVGSNCPIDPETYFIVCANILGSCYGSTGALTINPATSSTYFSNFPMVTIRDMVQAHILLRQHLQIQNIFLLVGGSMGGYQALEWSVMENNFIQNLFLLSTSAAESAWGIAIHTAQRLAIEADATWKDADEKAGSRGLKAARAIGLLSYRNYEIMIEKQSDTDVEKIDNFKASSYINYQGDKLVSRFHAYTYWLLTKAMDSHHLARGRNKSLELVLQSIFQKTLIVAITSDLLCPPNEQIFIAGHLPNSTLVEIPSSYGHDGFLIEAEKISHHFNQWMRGEI